MSKCQFTEFKSMASQVSWLTPVIPVTQEAETGGFWVQSQPQQKRGAKQFSETLSLNKIQNRAGIVAQWLSGPEFNPWYQKNENKIKNTSKFPLLWLNLNGGLKTVFAWLLFHHSNTWENSKMIFFSVIEIHIIKMSCINAIKFN